MKRLLWILIPALILVGFIYINRSQAGQHYIVEGEAGALLYAATFDGGAAEAFNSEWEQYEGRQSATVANGVLRVSVGTPDDGNYSENVHRFADFELIATAQAVEGPENNGYGVIFRLQDRQNYYAFLVSSDGYYAVQRVLNGQVKYLSNWINTTLDLPELNGVCVNAGLNQTNRIEVSAQGDQFEFAINGVRTPLCVPLDPEAESTYYEFFETPEERCVQGQIIDTLTDDAISSGQIALLARSFAFGETDRAVVIDFDSVLVYGR